MLRALNRLFTEKHHIAPWRRPRLLKGVSFEVNPGEVHCPGRRKWSRQEHSIKVITGVYKPQDGAEFFLRRPADRCDDADARTQSLGIQVIWQDSRLFPEMSVAETSVFTTRSTASTASLMKQDRRRVGKCACVSGVSLDLHKPLKELPIAQRQIVAIARALVGEARLVFMDEPTASLITSPRRTT